MVLGRQENLIETLVQMLSGKRGEAAALRSVLSLVREKFEFDYALIYEVNHSNNSLELTESSGVHSANPQIDFELFSDGFNGDPTPNHIFYCYSQLRQTVYHERLLSFSGAQSLVAAVSMDEDNCMYSLIALCNATEKSPPDKSARRDLECAFSILSDHTAIRMYKHRTQFAQTALESVLDNTGIDIYVNDYNTHDILYVNESMAKPYGGKEKFAGRKCWQVLFPGQNGPCEFCPQKKLVDEEGNPTKVYTWDYQRAFDGSWFRVFSAAFSWVDGRLAHVVSSADITDNKHNEELISYLANYDSLTNLPNRRRLVEECERRINQVSGSQTYVMFFDIDGFKNINDSLGHDAGDNFLVELGSFFTGIPLLKDVIYRNGGDEFVALLGDGVTEEDVRELSSLIHRRFQKPWKLKKGDVMCGISIGVAHYPEDGLTAEELLHKADQAMYYVKKIGGNKIQFANGEDDSSKTE